MTDNTKPSATILLLDSDPVSRGVLSETLERAGFLVVSVGDLGAAVDRMRKLRPGLLVVRPYISTMPGHMVAQHLRAASPGLPVLIVGGFVDDERISVSNAVHRMHVFPKPFPASELVSKVKEVLQLNSR